MVFKAQVDWEKELPKIKELGSMGTTMAQLGRRYGVSRQRMKQVVDRYIPNWGDNYGQIVNMKHLEDQRFAKWGIAVDDELYVKKRHKFARKRAAAKRIGWLWTIEFGDITWPTHCPILGIELDYFAEVIQENCVSFDQIDAGKGYVKGNVQIISWRANRIKNNGTAAEHRKIADYLDSIT